MRGKQLWQRGNDYDKGITPADAGKTYRGEVSGRTGQDHPRGCGENVADRAAFCLVLGSPPRMRGKLLLPLQRRRSKRITPADAGKTARSRCRCRCCWDHPRGCGENVFRKRLNPWRKGSPPRMRGKRRYGHRETRNCGITPADAGKTAVSVNPSSSI